MHSNMAIGPSFNGTIVAKTVSSIAGNRRIFSAPRTYAIDGNQELDLAIFSGKAIGGDTAPVGQMFNYLNKLELTDASGQHTLKLAETDGKGYKVSTMGSHVVVVKEFSQPGDSDLELCLDRVI